MIDVYESSDAGLIADMSRATFLETFAQYNTAEDMEKFMTLQFSKEQLAAEVGVPGHQFYIASINKIPAGYLFLKTNTHKSLPVEDAIEISRLYAYQFFIGKGVGKALMNKAIDTARSASKKAIWLGVWEHNLRAIDFYKAFGFEVFSEHDFLLGGDVQRDWLMCRAV